MTIAPDPRRHHRRGWRHPERRRQGGGLEDIDPSFFTYWCSASLLAEGNARGSHSGIRARVELESHDLGLKGDLAIVYAAAGKTDQAQKVLQELKEKADREYVPPYALAMANMAVGNLHGTYAWLDKMYEERSPVLIFMNGLARYDRLRGDARFQQLLRKIGFQE